MAAWVPVHRRCACFRLRCVWGQEPTRGEARSQVKLKRDASVVFGLQGAIGCPDPSLVPPWRLFPRVSLGGYKIL